MDSDLNAPPPKVTNFRFPLSALRLFPRLPAFTLVELLVVIAIITILATIASVGMNQIMQGTRMEQAGRVVLDEINLARQIAAARNVNVELRFIEKSRDDTPSSAAVFHGLQSGILNKTNAGQFSPVTRLTKLPGGVIMAPEVGLSSILGSLTKTNSSDPAYDFVSVVIRPTGALEPQSGLALNEPWFVTVVSETDAGAVASDLKNFITIQIDPWTARPTFYRP